MEEVNSCIEKNSDCETNNKSVNIGNEKSSNLTGVPENIEKQLIIDEILRIDEITNASEAVNTGDLSNQNDLKNENHFINLINNLILEKNCNEITAFFQVSKNIELLNENTFDVVLVCGEYLTDTNYNNDLQLYGCAENLLKLTAQYTSPKEVLFELLKMIKTTKSDNAFTTALKALQICLQRQKDKSPRTLEWALNSIINFMYDLPKPDYLSKGYDARQERLLEQNEQIYRILTNYITLTLFYEPLYNEFIELDKNSVDYTKNQLVRKDILTCFIHRLLAKPLALLDLSNTKKTKTNTYSLQCATTFTNHLSTLFGDPFHLLRYVELKSNITKKTPNEETNTDDYFMINDKCPLICIAIYYYMVICEEITLENIPKIYNPLYIFESCLYLIIELFSCDEPNIQYKGVLLGQKIIKNIEGIPLTVNSLQLKVHLKFYTSLTKIIIFSSLERLRKSSMLLFQNYFAQFDDDGKFYILKNLIKKTKHNGLLGYLMVSYKNLIDKQLKNTNGKLSENFRGQEFKNMLLNFICKLNNNIETDLMENYDQIISALNIVRYFLIGDKENQTGFWNFLDEIKKIFLEPLRLTIHLTRNNYKAEECRIRSGKLNKNEQFIQLSLLSGEDLPNFTKEQKLKMISCAFINFDLMESLLARVNESFHGYLQPRTSASFIISDKFARYFNTKIHYQHIIIYPNISKLNQRDQNNRRYYSTKIEDPDEFRAREEKKEEEFSKQTTNSDNTKTKEEEENNEKLNAIRTKILEASMPFVATYGWSRNAISHGAEQAGYPSVVHGIFPDGGIELIRYFYAKSNQELVDILIKETNNGELKIKDPTEFLVNAVKIRLQMIEPFINQWPQALAKMSLPQNVPKSLAQLLTLIDDICFFSGDKSVDFGWYSRRIGIATIYKMTEVYMLQDKSVDHQVTWEFLKNRMNEAKYIEEFIGTLGTDQQSGTQKKLAATFETARNILGLSYNRR